MIFLKTWERIGASFLTLGVLGLTLLFSAPLRAQVTGATLSGTVTDASGGIVPQAQISIKNVATAVTTTATSDAAGFYSAPNLLPGSYEMSASAPGFSTAVRSGITLTVGAQQVLNFSLQVGQLTEKVEVTGEASAVELISSSISEVVNSTTVVELPLNGRDWTQLAELQPGVTGVTTQPGTNVNLSPRGNRGFGQQISISGTRPQVNSYRLDGISVVDYAGGSPASVQGHTVGADAIAEFSVITSNYDAEYGRTAGGVINAITRSGTNQFHGDAFEFLRNQVLDARNFFDGPKIPPYRRNQFGGSVGGPIRKDKTFIFVDYEGLRQALSNSNVDQVPSINARNGILFNPDGTSCTIGVISPGCALTNSAGTVGVDPLVKPYLGFYPLPNAGLLGVGNVGLYDVATQEIDGDNYVTTRIDQKFSDKDSIFGALLIDRSHAQSPDPMDNVAIGNQSGQFMTSIEESHVFSPSMVNSLRVGFNRVNNFVAGNTSIINPLGNNLALGSLPGMDNPDLRGVFTEVLQGGQGPDTANRFVWNSFQAYDDASLTKGVHSLKFGFAFERMQTNAVFPPGPAGIWTFPSEAAFLTNVASSFAVAVPGTITARGIRQSLFGGYIQDDWKVRPNLTLNLGVRYEPSTVPSEVQGKLANMRTLTSTPPGNLGSPFFSNPTLRNVAPRIGFAWDPTRNGKTSVRGAFGMFDVAPLNYSFVDQEIRSAPFILNISESPVPQGAFPTAAAACAITVPETCPLSKLQLASVEFNPKRNYLMIWNLNVQRQLNSSTSVMVGFVGNHGVHNVIGGPSGADTNIVLPTLTPQGYLWPSPAGSGTKLNPTAGFIRRVQWMGSSLYDALETQVTKRMSHGFQVQGSYTWGKNIDNGSQGYNNSVAFPFYIFCASCSRGLSDYNIAQSLVINYLWNIPTPNNLGAIGSHVLGGWTVGGIFTAQTGIPVTPAMNGDPLGLKNNGPFDYVNRLTGPGCSSPVNPGNVQHYINVSCFAAPNPLTLLGNAGRNSVTGPGIADFDFSLFKNNYIRRISESFNAQFRAEFFNIINRANFQTPDQTNKLFNANGSPIDGAGSLTQTSTTSRQIQFALKIIW